MAPLLKKRLSIKEKRPKKFFALLNNHTKGVPFSQSHEDLLWEAYRFARKAHRGQKRKSGESYFEHPYQTALILSEMNMDMVTIVGGLLHDVIEDTDLNFTDVAERFGTEVAKLVEGVTKISGITFKNRQEEQADNFRKMLLNVADDIRVIIIKFADRLHNMRTISSLPRSKQRRIAIETRDVYAPLAHRLGMYKIRAELEDLILMTLDPEAYKFLQKKVKERKSERERYIKTFTQPLEKALKEQNIRAKITGRPKHFYSIYRKMKKRNKPFEEIYDLLAIRVIVNSKEECYAVLGTVHELFTPVMDRFKDYIASHKANYYQSIHTTVYGPRGHIVEIQIRTAEMNEIAEEGVAAHWRYKEGLSKPDEVDKYVNWLRDLVDVLQTESASPKDFMDTLKIDLFKNEIFVFTPMGDLIRLPLGATPVDFAFDIHTEVGYKCIGAKVDGKMVPLNTVLKSGQTVEIITSDNQRPSYAWLKFVKTSKAIGAIKKWIRKTQYQESVKLGKEMLEKENKRRRRVGFLKKVKEHHRELGYKNLEELFAAVGSGTLTVYNIFSQLFSSADTTEKGSFSERRFVEVARRNVKGVRVHGVDNLMVKFAKCCNPIPGDTIIGYVSRGRGVIIHKSDCNNLPALDEETGRMIDVTWDTNRRQTFLSQVKIMGQDKKHLLNDITEAISSTDTNIVSIEGKVDDTISHVSLILQVANLHHLNKVITKIQKVQGIISVERK